MSRRARKRSGNAGRGWLGPVSAIVAVLGVILPVGSYLMLRSYLHSDGFRKFLSAAVSRSAGVEGEFSAFRWDGLAVDTDGFAGEGGRRLASLRAEGLHTEVGFGGVKRGVWELKGTSVRKLEVEIDATRESEEAKTEDEKKVPVEEKARPKRWYPSEVELKDIEIGNADVSVKLKEGRMARVEGLSLRSPQGGSNRERKVTVDAGRLEMPGGLVPEMEIRKVEARYKEGMLFVTSAKAAVGGAGILEGTGEWNMDDRTYAFEGTVSGVPCDRLVNESWAKRLEGTVSSDFTVQGKGGETEARGSLVGNDVVMTALPVLDVLAAYVDTRRFRVLEFNEAKADWAWRRNETKLTGIVLSSEGLVRLEGELAIREGILDGRFRLGVVPGVLAGIPGAETDVFLPGERGLCWTELRISGTADDPKEDLSERLIAAAGIRMFDQLPGGDKVLKFSQSLLGGDTPEETIRRGLDVIEKGEDVVREAKDLLESNKDLLKGIFGGEEKRKLQK